ncbi:MAG: hypothetical protein RLZZ500_2048 [Bacteroidota bacterium]|jgi:hypothetical protein
MKSKFLRIALTTFVLLLVSCSKDDNQTEINEPSGTVKGTLTVKNGTKPVGGALVFVFDSKNEIHFTRTAADGTFTLLAPAGQRNLYLQTGNGSNFRTTLEINVIKEETITVDPTLCRLEQVANMAYVPGSFDKIELIVQSLGYNITSITHNDLGNYATISQYDIIFLNCGGKQNTLNAQIDTNLANFVTNGGSLYASDWAVAYLTGGGTNSNSCNLPFGFISDDKMCAINNGPSGYINGATIPDANLAAAIGFSSLNIDYDLGSWEQINAYDPTFWEALVMNPANNQPLMVRNTDFSGGAVGTPVGGDDTGWVTICHHDEASNSDITITISASDWAVHQGHGDTLGPCQGNANSGTIYYTTFHNHASGNIGNTSYILEYVILNL